MRNCLLSLLLLGSSLLADAQDTLQLPSPFATKSYRGYGYVMGWQPGETPKAPFGMGVTLYADNLQNPRSLYQLPNGDVLVVEANSNHSFFTKVGAVVLGANKSNSMKRSSNRITLLRDTNHDGFPDQRFTFLSNLNQPFGILLLNNKLYVANTDALWCFPYHNGDTIIRAAGQKIATFPAGKNNIHWTRNIIANPAGTKIYIAIGSGSDHAEDGIENEVQRATVIEMNPDGSNQRIYASGLRNPVGMAWEPTTNTLWTVVNERDKMGNDLVPDYMTGIKDGGFYGWPYYYYGKRPDPRVKVNPDYANANVVVPDFTLGAHTASLGLIFYTGNKFPERYHNGAFIAQHGSWNRKPISGYKVLFVPFKDGMPAGPPEDFLTGFVYNEKEKIVKGRPVALLQLNDGSVLLTDDKTNRIWRIQ
ncbi:sorbosone dehydrogenase family protein [Chitinophaga silvatica]|uniref:Sorbosone dehydrogenase family protein n=1 Tax=Chitinophaga silvatica TaxID=2282649 RepID=A0A3E1YG52_9BACT|nr:sorbosone dehydrogenase family protein [Chitinophaga silvatica]RFS26346.1 sorbosone dehydrogenase family protein [Chitinophaga silvatica]